MSMRRQLVGTLGRYLARGCAVLVGLLDPQALIFSGGLMVNNPLLLQVLQEELMPLVPAWEKRNLKIVSSSPRLPRRRFWSCSTHRRGAARLTARLFASKPWRSACCLIGTALIGILFPLFSGPRSQTIEVLDPLLVPAAGDPGQAVVTVSLPQQAPAINCDLVVAGGSLGGVAAALQAARAGLQVCMTESTRWLGGQITAEGVSALDENRWVETTGATGSYQQLRTTIRSYYRSIALSRNSPADFNPGACWVSALCFEPTVALNALQQMVRPFEASHKLLVLLRTVPVKVLKTETKITSILAYKFESKGFVKLNGKVFIDATQLGDVLPIAGAQFRVGADSREDTGEPDAATSADPAALQSFNFPFVLSSDKSHSISTSKPLTYDALSRNFGLSVGNDQGELTRFGFYRANPGTAGSFWTYRRLIDHTLFPSSLYPADLSMINWDSNDVCDSNYLSLDPLAQAKAFQHGKQTSIAFAWWLQHEAPADDGVGKGYPQLTLRKDVLGSSDGLSQVPYIREARRMKALKTIKEQDVAEPWQAGVRAAFFADTVGIGYYPIDIHSCGASQKLPKSKPYQIQAPRLFPGMCRTCLLEERTLERPT